MLFENISVLTDAFTVLSRQYVGVQGDTIAYIGAEKPVGDWGERYNGSGKLLMPGLVNAHSHAPMTLLRGYGENLSLQRWLSERIFPFEDKLSDAAVAPATRLAIAEMLRFGTVSFSDMYFFSQTMADAILEIGIKCNLSRGLTVFDDSAYEQTAAYKDNCDLLERYHGAGDGRLKIDLCIHGEYTTTPKVVEALAQHAKETGSHVHIHLSETMQEHEECKQRHGMTPAAYFEKLGLFDQPTTAAHCVWLEDSDFEILSRKGVTVAACPVSNMKLASGFARVPKMLHDGIRVALGTDSVASNNNLNLFQEIFLFANLYKGASQDPTVVTPEQVLAAAPIHGMQSQGRTDSGFIRTGMKADLAVLDVHTPWMVPVHDWATNLVYSSQGSDVCLTMVDGKVLYQDGEYKTIDIEKVMYETQQETNKILAQL